MFKLCSLLLHYDHFLILQILETLLPLSDLTARVNSAVDLILSTDSSINRDSLHFAASTFYYKLKAADGYTPATKYQGDVLLLRAKLNSNYEQNLGDDYKLKEVLHNVLCAVTVQRTRDALLSKLLSRLGLEENTTCCDSTVQDTHKRRSLTDCCVSF